ncbi:MAG: DUF4129 domain-containing protein [Acidimicrobiales bacterium]
MPEVTSTRWGRSGSRRLGVVLPVAMALVLVVALGASSRAGAGGLRLGVAAGNRDIGYLGVALLLLAVGVVGAVVWVLWPQRRKKSDEPPPIFARLDMETPWWAKALLLVCVACVFAAIVSGVVLIGKSSLGRQAGTTGNTMSHLPGATTLPPARRPHPAAAPAAFAIHAWVVVLALGVALVLAVCLYILLRNRPTPGGFPGVVGGPGGSRRTVARALEAALRELEGEADPRLAVVRAYAAMEQILANRGVGRRPDETPYEYLERSLEQGGVPAPAATHLTGLFEQARFSDHVITAAISDAARQALEAVRVAPGVTV